jgi:hypothetical protein
MVVGARCAATNRAPPTAPVGWKLIGGELDEDMTEEEQRLHGDRMSDRNRARGFGRSAPWVSIPHA